MPSTLFLNIENAIDWTLAHPHKCNNCIILMLVWKLSGILVRENVYLRYFCDHYAAANWVKTQENVN